jgi:hypothetical protein
MSIERFQTFALYRDRRRLTKNFSIAWFMASWSLALCFLVILLAQISEKGPDDDDNDDDDSNGIRSAGDDGAPGTQQFYINLLDMDLFPGPHSEKRSRQLKEEEEKRKRQGRNVIHRKH